MTMNISSATLRPNRQLITNIPPKVTTRTAKYEARPRSKTLWNSKQIEFAMFRQIGNFSYPKKKNSGCQKKVENYGSLKAVLSTSFQVATRRGQQEQREYTQQVSVVISNGCSREAAAALLCTSRFRQSFTKEQRQFLSLHSFTTQKVVINVVLA